MDFVTGIGKNGQLVLLFVSKSNACYAGRVIFWFLRDVENGPVFCPKDVVTTFRNRYDEVRVHPLSFRKYISAQTDTSFTERHLNDCLRLDGPPQTLTIQNEQQKYDYL